MTEKICPECNMRICRLNYSGWKTESYSIYGTCDLEGEDEDEDGSEFSDTDSYEIASYQCPECGAEIQPQNLLDVDDENKEEKNKLKNKEIREKEIKDSINFINNF